MRYYVSMREDGSELYDVLDARDERYMATSVSFEEAEAECHRLEDIGDEVAARAGRAFDHLAEAMRELSGIDEDTAPKAYLASAAKTSLRTAIGDVHELRSAHESL